MYMQYYSIQIFPGQFRNFVYSQIEYFMSIQFRSYFNWNWVIYTKTDIVIQICIFRAFENTIRIMITW